jgi:hypothetical protein
VGALQCSSLGNQTLAREYFVVHELYLIQGVFFQERSGLGLGYVPGGEGYVAVIERGLCQYLYAGEIHRDPGLALGGLAGTMRDQFGESALSRIWISETRLHFQKKYCHREDVIEYSFSKRADGLWEGVYSGKVVGQGTTRCILNRTPEDFLQPPETQKENV